VSQPLSAAELWQCDVDSQIDHLLDEIEQARQRRGLTEAEAVAALEDDGHADLAEAYENWLDEGDPDELDGSRAISVPPHWIKLLSLHDRMK
jgi:hypothetical protein